jgi:hypothetical protein
VNRVDFTINIVGVLYEMILLGEHPIIDYVLRSTEEQKRLFDKGLSKCDGTTNYSAHQSAKAMDIYFPDLDDIDKDLDKNELLPPRLGWEHWHEVWEHHGGKPMIEWDKGHFEG